MALTGDINYFWRLRTEDGLYSPSGQIVRAPAGSEAYFVGTALSLTAQYTFFPGLVFTAIHTLFSPGRFIEETGPDDDINFTELTLQLRF